MSIRQNIATFPNLRVLVIGDTMMDAYYLGKIERMSPEAPVPIVAFNHKDHRPGGAANVALNIRSMGAEALLCSVVGNDPEGVEIMSLLANSGISPEGILVDTDRPTTVKTRVIAGDKHLLRMDHESTLPISQYMENQVLSYCLSVLNQIHAVIFEDYNKGLLTDRVIEQIIAACNAKGIPTIVDPKKEHFFSYKSCTLFKPNRKEIAEGLEIDWDLKQIPNVQKAAAILQERLQCEHLLVTLSEDGMILRSGGQFHHIEAHARNIVDVSGAGDTVVSVAALCLASGMPIRDCAEVANIAGGLVCEKVGVVPVQPDELLAAVNSLHLNSES